jgi:hypothetical protein
MAVGLRIGSALATPVAAPSRSATLTLKPAFFIINAPRMEYST